MSVDSKIFNEALFAAGQVASRTPGKTGIRKQIGQKVRSIPGGVALTGEFDSAKSAFSTARGLAKCAVNILTERAGSVVVRARVPDLVGYVREPMSRQDVWPFAALFTPSRAPTVTRNVATYTDEHGSLPVVFFSCASGLFAVVPHRDRPGMAKIANGAIKDSVREFERRTGKKIDTSIELTSEIAGYAG